MNHTFITGETTVFFKRLLFRWRVWIIQRTVEPTNKLVENMEYSRRLLSIISDELLSQHTPRKSLGIIISTHCHHYGEMIMLLKASERCIKENKTLTLGDGYDKRTLVDINLDNFLVNVDNEPYDVTNVKNTLLKILNAMTSEINDKREADGSLISYHTRKLTYVLKDVRVITEVLIKIARDNNE